MPDDPYTWQKERRRTEAEGARFEMPISGLGPAGAYTLWVRSPNSFVRTIFKGTQPVREIVEGESDPAIQAARAAVLRSAISTGPGMMRIDMEFLRYAAMVIAQNYRLTDDEMGMLLSSGDKWYSPMLKHLLGGDNLAHEMREHAPALLERVEREYHIPPPQPLVSIPFPTPKRSLWRRLLRR